METDPKIEELLKKIEKLAQQHTLFQAEIYNLKSEIIHLKEQLSSPETAIKSEAIQVKEPLPPSVVKTEPLKTTPRPPTRPPQYQSSLDIEKFIGENISNKIGIIIMVLGISIGVKYAIDNDWINPLMRIILGYFSGLILVGLSIKLRPKYTDLSAVILSGSLASLYFVTYAAYDFYGLFPQALAFLMMVIITIFTVVAALSYDLQVIAIGGLIGAYCIPFLLSNNTGKPIILFSYMLLTNIGILFLSFKKEWKWTNNLAFFASWFIFFVWLISYYNQFFAVGLIFSTLFFILFYITFIAYKFVKNQPFSFTNVTVLLLNSSIYYGIGYLLLANNEVGKHFLGLFTLANAILHFVVSRLIYQRELVDKSLFFLVSGLTLTFVTLTIPVQLEGHWIPIFWACEMALLFWIGRTKQVPAYEKLSFPVMILATYYAIADASAGYENYFFSAPAERLLPVLNIHFLEIIFVLVSLFLIYIINKNEKYDLPINNNTYTRITLNNILGTVILLLGYFIFYSEVNSYFNQNYVDSYRKTDEFNSFSIGNQSIILQKNIWIAYCTLFYLILINILNLKKVKTQLFARAISIITLFTIFCFLTITLYSLGEIKDLYLYQIDAAYFQRGTENLGLRYIGFILLGILLYLTNKNRERYLSEIKNLAVVAELVIYATILWCIASEIINWLELYMYKQVYKTVLSILFGIYALFLIAMGIKQEKTHLRIAGMFLFGITLIKLFFYDLANLDTISKTIIMIILGGLLLTVSFIYNKIKQNSDDDKNNSTL